MGNTRGLTDKPISPETVEEDGKVVARHTTTVVTDPESADAVQVPDADQYPQANATGHDFLRDLTGTSPADALDADEASVNEVQRIDPSGTVSGGTYDFVLLPGTSRETAFTGVAYDATPTAINALIAAEDALVDGEGNQQVVASGAAVGSGNLDFTFSGSDVKGENQPELTVEDADITGGGTLAAVTVTAGVHADD